MKRCLVIGALLSWIQVWPATAQTGPDTASARECAEPIELRSSLVSDARRSLLRALTLSSAPEQSGLFRAASLPWRGCADGYTFLRAWHPTDPNRRVDLMPVQISAVNNTAFPRTINDGAAWQGVGLNLTATAGVSGRWRFLNASVAPEAYYHENRDFAFVPSTFEGRSEYSNPYQFAIDNPTRFGPNPFRAIRPGQSYVQAVAKSIGVTVSTENLWIGAAEVYPLMLSYTAPGFAHVRIGTQRPIDLGIARVEFQLLFASVHESDYFDSKPQNDNQYFTTTMLVIEPKFVEGLYLGLVRAYHDSAQATGQSLGFYASNLIDTPFGATKNQAGNGIGGVLARWVLPESGFEVYAEWGRDDYTGDLRDALREPDWTHAYVLGFQKAFSKPNRLTRFYGELIHLGESSPARAGRGFASFYTHSPLTRGHTNEGQLLGAAIGPGSDAQLLGLDIFSGSGRTGFRVERTRYDDDTYTRTFARRWGETRHDVEINLSATRAQFVGPLELEASVLFSRRYDRQWLLLPSELPTVPENNWSTRVSAAWHPPW